MDNANIYKTGDLVVGSADPSKSVYSPTGARIRQDGVSIFGNPEDLEAQRIDIVRSATFSGGKPLSSTVEAKTVQVKKKQSKGKQIETLNYTTRPLFEPVQTKESELETIQFENSFGRMKAKVEHILEHDIAFMLIFSDEDSVVFEPKVGENLVLHTPDKRRVDVYYPGVIFNSPGNSKKSMILFKSLDKNQE
jgi:hypothetical protein